MSNIKKFKSRKDVSEFLKTKNINTSNWTEEKWQSINSSQAEIHIQALAEAMWDAKNEGTSKELKAGEWHIPFYDKMDGAKIHEMFRPHIGTRVNIDHTIPEKYEDLYLKIATARCARLSYMTFDKEIDHEKDIKLHDMLLESKHMSPFEHCARVATDEEYYSNIKGEIDSSEDQWGFFHHEYYPVVFKNGDELEFVSEDYKYGWFNNFRGFIPYRYIIEKNKSI